MKKLVLGVFLFCSVALAQQPLNNASIIKLSKAGLGADVITAMIQNQPGSYDVSPSVILHLKQEGISDKVLAAMVAKDGHNTQSAEDRYANLDIGVYLKSNKGWTVVPTETVNWRTGGFLKSLATDGIVKGDINGRLKGAHSGTKVTGNTQILIKSPDGSEATDFQLVHLHVKRHAREFRTVTGGVFHSSGGTTRDAVHFTEKRIAKDTYLVTLPANLEPGEYAFLAPGFSASTTSGSIGRAYSFSFIE